MWQSQYLTVEAQQDDRSDLQITLQEVIDMIDITAHEETMPDNVRHEETMPADVRHEETMADEDLQ